MGESNREPRLLSRLAGLTAATALGLLAFALLVAAEHAQSGWSGGGLALAIVLVAGVNVGASLLLRREALNRARSEQAAGTQDFRDVIESMSEGIMIIDAEGRVSAWNERLLAMLPHLRALLRPGIATRELSIAAIAAARPDWTAQARATWVEAREASLQRDDYATEMPLDGGAVVQVRHRRISGGGTVAVYRDITSERRAIEALALSEARFRDAVDSMGEGLTLWDREGRLLLWSARFVTLLPDVAPGLRAGLTAEQINVAAARRMFPDWPEERITGLVAERLSARRAFGTPFLLTLNDGRIIEFVDHRTSEGGQVTIYRDVTQAHRAAAALTVTETRFRNAIEALGEGFALWDADDRLVTWNERFIDINRQFADMFCEGVTFEATLRELTRRNSAWVPAEGTEEWITRRLEKRRAGGRSELRFDSGVVVEITDHRSAGGGIVSIYRDVTEERRALDRLSQSEARFRDGIQSMADGFVMWDAQDRLVTWNERHLEMLPYLRPHLRVGRLRREIVEVAVEDGFPDLTPAEREAWVAERIASFRQYERVFVMRPAGGCVIEVVERRTTEGGSVLLYRDVTEREQQTNDLRRALTAEREANQQQRRFIAIASHEFRTPLTVIDGSAQRLLVHLESAAPEVIKRLQRIRATVLRMTQLIDRTLSSARLDDGRLELRPERFDLAALLREACARQGSISAEFTLALDAPPSAEIVGDPRLVELVVTNLLSNAVKYSGASRIIAVGLTVTATDVTITVQDRGIGVPEAELQRLFQRYFRASTAAGIPGTGIGLHLVRELVSMHGGAIAVESALGHGSSFKVTLPLVASPAAVDAQRSRLPS